jgi:hypothetical protein
LDKCFLVRAVIEIAADELWDLESRQSEHKKAMWYGYEHSEYEKIVWRGYDIYWNLYTTAIKSRLLETGRIEARP